MDYRDFEDDNSPRTYFYPLPSSTYPPPTQAGEPFADRCKNVFYDSLYGQKQFKAKVIYSTLAPSILMMLFLAFLIKRKILRPDIQIKRPGIPAPLNLLEEDRDRFSYLCGFILCANSLSNIISNDSPFTWNYPPSLKGVMILISCILLGIYYYPVFGTLGARQPVAHIIGTLFIWFFTAYTTFFDVPCDDTLDSKTGIVFYVLGATPMYLCMIYLCLAIPLRGIRIFLKKEQMKPTPSDFVDDCKYQAAYVRKLLSRKGPYDDRMRRIGDSQTLFNCVYKVEPGFRYSLGILTGCLVGIFMVYRLGIELIQFLILLHDPIIAFIYTIPETFSKYGFEKVPQLLHNWGTDLDHITEELAVFFNIFLRAMLFSSCAATLMTILSLLLALKNYRRHMTDIFKGRYQHIPRRESWNPRNIVLASVKYVGYQLGHAFWGILIFLFIATIMSFSFAISFIVIIRNNQWEYVWSGIRRAWPVVLYITIQIFVQNLIVHFFFLQRNEAGQRILGIDNRRLFCNFQYFMVFASAPLGLLSCLLRIFKGVVFGVWFLPRLDVSVLSRTTERFDNGFNSYLAMLQMENMQTNPTMVLFVGLLSHSVSQQSSLPDISSSSNLNIVNGNPMTRRFEKWGSNRIRNRWALLLTLHRNPGLRVMRKRFLESNKLNQRVTETCKN